MKTEGGNIYAALAAIMAEAKALGKDSRNQQQGFNFRGIDAVMNHLHPVFAKHGVFVLPEVLEERTEDRQTKSGGHLLYRILKVRFSFLAQDGSSVSSLVIGEGMDSGDKAANKAMAVALKYAVTQMLLLPYDEVDPDAYTPPESRKKTDTPPAKPAAQVAAPVPAKPPAPLAERHEETRAPDEGCIVLELVLGEVRTQTGEGPRGPWTRYYTKADDGEYYSTFNIALGAKLADLARDGNPVLLTYHEKIGPKGPTREVLKVEPAPLPDESDGDSARKALKEIPF